MNIEAFGDKKLKVQDKPALNVVLEGFNIKKFLMEFVGTFALVYFGNWATIFNDIGKSNNVAVALTVGFITTVFTWIGASISGAHFNPITTLSMIFLKKIGWSTGCIYWVFQLLGGMIAGSMIYLQVPPQMLKTLLRNNGLGIPAPDRRFLTEAVWSEMMATFFYQFTFIVLLLDKRSPKEVYAIGAGAMMSVGTLTIGSVSGGGLNPARVFGPAIITSGLNKDILVYIGGPLVGALLATFLYKAVYMEKKPAAATQEYESSEEEVVEEIAQQQEALDEEVNSDEGQVDEEIHSEDGPEAETKGNNTHAITEMSKDEKLRLILGKSLVEGDGEN